MNIQKFTPSELLDMPLADWGAGRPAGAGSASRITGKKVRISALPAGSYGIWEAGPGTFKRDVETGEYMHILSGDCTFTDEDGTVITIMAGDTLFFPPATKGVWTVRTAVRKVYVML